MHLICLKLKSWIQSFGAWAELVYPINFKNRGSFGSGYAAKIRICKYH